MSGAAGKQWPLHAVRQAMTAKRQKRADGGRIREFRAIGLSDATPVCSAVAGFPQDGL